jgi:hypothetical protein
MQMNKRHCLHILCASVFALAPACSEKAQPGQIIFSAPQSVDFGKLLVTHHLVFASDGGLAGMARDICNISGKPVKIEEKVLTWDSLFLAVRNNPRSFWLPLEQPGEAGRLSTTSVAPGCLHLGKLPGNMLLQPGRSIYSYFPAKCYLPANAPDYFEKKNIYVETVAYDPAQGTDGPRWERGPRRRLSFGNCKLTAGALRIEPDAALKAAAKKFREEHKNGELKDQLGLRNR